MKRAQRWAPWFLAALGVLQMIGAGLGVPEIQGLAAATAASPAPRVFTTIDGFEPFSTKFFIEFTDVAGHERSYEITPERYANAAGAYNRRNAYGAVLAGGPVLATRPFTRRMYESVSRHAVCDDALLLRELEIDPDDIASPVAFRYVPRPGVAPSPDLPLRLEIACR